MESGENVLSEVNGKNEMDVKNEINAQNGIDEEEEMSNYFSENRDLGIVEWFVERVMSLPGYSDEKWGIENSTVCRKFVNMVQAGTLFVMVHKGSIYVNINRPPVLPYVNKPSNSNRNSSRRLLREDTNLKEEGGEKLFYFVKNGGVVLSMTNIDCSVQYGSITGNAVESLMHLMNEVYMRRLQNVTSWPQSVQQEFSSQYYRFMSSLSETVNQSKGKTVLYLPPNIKEDMDGKDKDLIQQLESTIIHWTRQIKEVVNNQDNAHDAEGAGPIEEIQFWEHRTQDLSGITQQLSRPGVRMIVSFLQTVKSSYLQPFEVLSKIITQGSIEANDNLQFLTKLGPVCKEIQNATPMEIASKLTTILSYIRLIWKHSRFYNTNDRITSLLRKVSNDIIACCCRTISLQEIFYGNMEQSIYCLKQSIACGVAWKKIYFATAKAVKECDPQHPWSFDDTSIFAQVDAFVQRCRDLLEVCQGQIQFARKISENEKAPLPCFGGNVGERIVKSLLGIETQFDILLDKLRKLEYDILDVKVTHWHGDFNTFKNGIKDLEAMTQNVINASFESITTIASGVDLIMAFQSIANRESIHRCLNSRTTEMINMFKQNVANARNTYEKLKTAPPLTATEPQYAGSALWARSLLQSSEKEFQRLAPLLAKDSAEYTDIQTAFEGLKVALNDFIRKKYSDWIEELNSLGSSNLSSRLETPLLARQSNDSVSAVLGNKKGLANKTKRGFLECNFDRPLLKLFAEVHYWHYFQGELQIPYIAHDISNQREQLRVLREHVLLVVRDYNRILMELSSNERRLFEDIIRRLDRRIVPGLQKLTWLSKGIVEWYVIECRKHCAETYQIVMEFQANKQLIKKNCKFIASMSLISIERNNVYDEGVFEAKQELHRKKVVSQLEEAHAQIHKTMAKMHEHFSSGSSEVQREWTRFVLKSDKILEDALRLSVKKSLLELSKAINGDAKSEPQPLFRVYVVLEEDNTIEFRPLMLNLTQMVNTIAKKVLSVISVVPRLRSGGILTNKSIAPQSDIPTCANNPKLANNENDEDKNFYQTIVNDEEILKVVVTIMNGMSSNATELQKYLGYWENKYKLLWNQDKQAFIRRYAKANRPVSQFRNDIDRYREQQSVIQNEDLTNTINFIQIDTSLLKVSLVDHTVQWIGKLTGLLNNTARDEMSSTLTNMESEITTLMATPDSLEVLGENIELLAKVKNNASAIQSKFGPLQEKYELLTNYDVQITEMEQNQLSSLTNSWTAYEKMMSESDALLAKSKINMKQNLQDAVVDLQTSMDDLRTESLNNLPYNEMPDAAQRLVEYEAKMQVIRTRQTSLKKGLRIFEIEEKENESFKLCEADIKQLQKIWKLHADWESCWEQWKAQQFKTIEMDSMSLKAAEFFKDVSKMKKDMSSWKIWDSMKAKIDQFRATLPLILDLKAPALRPRHWAQLKSEMNHKNSLYNPEGDDFTLEKVFTLGFHLHAEFIGTLSANANKELSIEQALKSIEERWATINIDMSEYKQIYYKVQSTEDLYLALEDDQVQLSTIKASPFFSAFEARILHWENSLSSISEVVENLLNVQRCWIYLESIFMTSEDIRKQLPLESALFDDVNAAYIKITKQVVEQKQAIKVAADPQVLKTLFNMQEKLDEIQKCLDQYLEMKRMLFPRFYFLSNDDLLEILGHQKNPDQVQKHIKKCFEAIQTLNLIPPGSSLRNNNPTFEATAMNAPDGEIVQFASVVIVSGAVEAWLLKIEKQMVFTLEKLFAQCLQGYRGKKEKWIKENPGQLLISCGQTAWTQECTKALNEISKSNAAVASGAPSEGKKPLKQLKKKWVSYLNKLADMVRGSLSPIDRKKVVALITMEIHSRDVLERMMKQNCKSVNDFEWLMQLRLYFSKDDPASTSGVGICEAKQTVTCLTYSYEYQGNNGRLVVTPLTDRCVLTMTTALHLNRGGNPLGPAGTGKTETVKDLGKNLAKYVIVFNCSDGLDYKSVGRMFSGLVQSGGWGCFDEFNRIEIEVLSVVAQQVLTIMQALSAKSESLTFLGSTIKCNHNMGIFITMNPGYAGRTELPDNLKALMRPCAMMVPDLALISEVMLQAEGFRDAKNLARKTTTLYGLMVQQLSKQDHYDFGLRSLKAVLNMAGALKRNDPDMIEEHILLRALRDMNMPKFIREDTALFRLLLGDLFPSVELPNPEYGELKDTILSVMKAKGLQLHTSIIDKVIQLYESQVTRHCNMLVGQTMAGKSTVWQILEAAKTELSTKKGSSFAPVRIAVLNPKSITLNEIYGVYDLTTFEWVDGILSTLFRNFASDERKDEKWILLDGPVDTLWIESMNSVMDDNKVLTLINGDRITMTPSMVLLFEVQDLSVASPATVSRAGMIYMDVNDLQWRPYVASWVERTIKNVTEKDVINQLFETFVVPILEFKENTGIVESVPISDLNGIQSLCSTYSSLRKIADAEESLNDEDLKFIRKTFLFCLTWSLMGAADLEGRKQLDSIIRDIDPIYPPVQTVYEYYLDTVTKEFKHWKDKLGSSFRIPANTPAHKVLVPTIDTLRYGMLMQILVRKGRHCLFVGQSGVGKTSIIQKEFEQLVSDQNADYSKLGINFSSATSSSTTQAIIEGVLEKKSMNKFGPLGGKKLIAFVDDLNMPQKDMFGSQPPIELLRQWMDYQCWYDRKKQSVKYIHDMQLVSAMGPPGGGRSVISARFQSKFHLVNIGMPNEEQLKRIFETLLVPKLVEFDDEVKPMGPSLVSTTIQLYKLVEEKFLPTPTNCHYLFNLRDMAKVVAGLLTADKLLINSKDGILRMWMHECSRVFSDRLTSSVDRDTMKTMLDGLLHSNFQVDSQRLLPEAMAQTGPIFSSLYDETTARKVGAYDEITSIEVLKGYLEGMLENYNLEPGLIPMDLVMFTDAMLHLLRIHRVISLPRGDMMLVGVGGSGRQSLTKLAAYLCQYQVFQIEITKNYKSTNFHDDLKAMYQLAGVEGKSTIFLFNDTQIKEESFLEDVNNILSSGEVPNLFEKDEQMSIFEAIRMDARRDGAAETPDSLWDYFINRVRCNLHLVLAMSPIGENFRNRCRQFPSLVNATTIDWFDEWPVEALSEVGLKFLETNTIISDDDLKAKIASVFAVVHSSVVATSKKMLQTLKRHNYVTPTNYLALVKGYQGVLADKANEIKSSSDKLKNGLCKLDESRVQVEEMSEQLVERKAIVAQKNKDCSELLIVIVSERRVADEQKKQVENDSERIGREETETKKIANDAQKDLDEALPALERAMTEVDKLDKNSISEVKAYANPPALVALVLSAVMILFGLPTDWATAKKKIGETNFLQQIKTFDKDAIKEKTVSMLRKYTGKPEFNPEQVNSVSSAAGALCSWVGAMEVYSRVARQVAPKREKLKKSQQTLQAKQQALAEAKGKLEEVIKKVDQLKDQYDGSVNEKNALREEAELLELKLSRAEQLVSGLSGERERWEISIKDKESALINVAGDALVGAAFLSYAGPFDNAYRTGLVDTWMNRVQQQQVPISTNFQFVDFLEDPVNVREWNAQGLPRDNFSAENGVMTTRCTRWPLMVDPQGQANAWIKVMEGSRLEIVDPMMKDFIRKLENGIRFGTSVLMQDILEELDPSLEPVLSKSIVKVGNREVLRLGDKELDYNRDFRFFMTTKLQNPHYTPEVSTKTTIVNCVVKEQGLEAQLLGIVVQLEEPELEVQKSELVTKVANAKKKLVDLENNILRLLSTAEGSLLDDESLVNTLNASKATSEEVTAQLVVSEDTERKIDLARNGYKSVSLRASILYFVLNDMAVVDFMYQFSLSSYVDLFQESIENSRNTKHQLGADDSLTERIKTINSFHTYAVYAYACRGLFKRHKLLFSFQMCTRVLQSMGKIALDEYGFLLRGGLVLDHDDQRQNPAPHLFTAVSWDNITELSKLSKFSGLDSSFEQLSKDWQNWYQSTCPEIEQLPGDWEGKCTEFHRMLLIRSIRPDRLCNVATQFTSNNLGPEFVDPPPFDLEAIYASSNFRTPLIFILSPGVDPTSQLKVLARKLEKNMEDCALGQGQAPIAEDMVTRGIVNGSWVFLANCHLMLSWSGVLEKIIDNYSAANADTNPKFRLWLTSDPTPKFPMSILQRGIKMTTEPPSGIKANLVRLYGTISEERFKRCKETVKYKRLLFCLCWFHALLLERRKFNNLGWNIPYEFNESDFAISEDVLGIYIDEYEDTPWEALKYLIAQANYGGRVTDDWDRRLMIVYVNQFFNERILQDKNAMLSDSEKYYVPSDGDLASYVDYAKQLPLEDSPEAFGQHPNAEIASQIDGASYLLSTILTLQPVDIVEGGVSNDEKVMTLVDSLRQNIAKPINLVAMKKILISRGDPEALKTVLLQEIERYNTLLKVIHHSLKNLELGIQGFVVITPELEEVYNGMLNGSVPKAWSFCYPSLKSLGSWTRDLELRIAQISSWANDCMPKVFWLAGFTYPTGFLTALLQTSARKNGISIDSLSWEFLLVNQHEDTITEAPADGAYIRGLYLEGARWDFDNECLTDPLPMELQCNMPLIHFKPVEAKRKSTKNVYSCPLYIYPIRTGTRERPSFMIAVDLKCGAQKTAELWTQRGTALLLSLAN